MSKKKTHTNNTIMELMRIKNLKEKSFFFVIFVFNLEKIQISIQVTTAVKKQLAILNEKLNG